MATGAKPGNAGKGIIEKALVGAVAVAVVKGLKKGPGQPDGSGAPPANDGGRGRSAAADGQGGRTTTRPPAAGGVKGLVGKLDRYQRSHAWLGFPVGAGKKFGEDQAGNLAALISYYTFFSIFPLLLALVTVLGLVLKGNVELQRQVVDSAVAQFPVIGDQIRDNVGSIGGSWVVLLVGLGGALWAGMGAVDAAQNAMNSVWDVPIRDKPKFLTRRLRSLMMLVVIGGGLFLTAGVSTLATAADSIGPFGRVLGPVLSAAVNIVVFMVAFRVLTERDLGWSDVLPGAVLAGIAAALLQLVGGFIMDQKLQGASQTYGTFAVVIGLLSWLYLQAQVTLFAAEINVVRTERLWPRSLVTHPDDLTEADRRALAKHAETEERVPEQDVRTAVPGEQQERGVDRDTADRHDRLAGAK